MIQSNLKFSQACFAAFSTAFAACTYQILTGSDFEIALLLTLAMGCIYLLAMSTEHFSAQSRYRVVMVRLHGAPSDWREPRAMPRRITLPARRRDGRMQPAVQP
ncbi:MAG: hypothetical protein ACRETW_03870 [Stenotrophobium sp.]